jgi:protein-disulfide isomerase
MKNKWFVLGAIGAAVAIFAVLSLQKTEGPPTAAVSPSGSESAGEEKAQQPLAEEFVRPYSPRVGNSMSLVTVVEWLDPECESCRAMHPAVKRIVAEFEDRVLFVTRYMPYHGGSMWAASALEEARQYGKFEEALNLLFEKQPEWGNHQEPRPDLIPTYLASLGIPAENLEQDVVIAKHGEKVRQDEEDGKKVGVRGTPSFFINGEPLMQLGESQLRDAIEQALANQ